MRQQKRITKMSYIDQDQILGLKEKGANDDSKFIRWVFRLCYPRLVYVDRLTKKQQEALSFIDIAGSDRFIPGVGGKGRTFVKIAGNHRVPKTAYILDC